MREPANCGDKGQTVIFVAVDGKLAGLLGIADPIKTGTPEAVRMLRDEGLHVDDVDGRQSRRPQRPSPRKLGHH